MDTITMLRSQFKTAHDFLEASMQDVAEEHAHWQPQGNANPIGASYAHVVIGEDAILNGMVRGEQPLMMTKFGGTVGVSEPPPMPDQGDWDKWARSVKVDLPKLREYAQAVYANTDDYLASLANGGLEREIDLSGFHLGTQTVGWFVGNVMLSHVASHWGEIACMKGQQGVKGYPF